MIKFNLQQSIISLYQLQAAKKYEINRVGKFLSLILYRK